MYRYSHRRLTFRQMHELALCAGQLAHVPSDYLAAAIANYRGKRRNFLYDAHHTIPALEQEFGWLCPVCLRPVTWDCIDMERREYRDPMPDFHEVLPSHIGDDVMKQAHRSCVSLSRTIDGMVATGAKFGPKFFRNLAKELGPMPHDLRFNPRRRPE